MTFERTGRRDPRPRTAPGGAAAGTYSTFGPRPGAPPPDHDHRRDTDERASLDDHGRRRIGKRRAADPNRRLAGSPLAGVRFRAGSGEECTAAGPRREPFSTQLEPPPLLLGLLRLPVGHDPVLPVALALRRPCHSGSGSGLQATPPFVAKNGPVVECLSHSPPRAGGRLQPAPAARVIPAGRLPARLRRVQAEAGGGSVGGAVLVGEARRSGDSPRTALTASCARFPASWSRRASAAWSKATCSVWARWAATTAVRRCALRALARGSGGCVPGRPVLRQRRERPGVRRGAQRPLASQVCTHTG